jgi:hypothetical protein
MRLSRACLLVLLLGSGAARAQPFPPRVFVPPPPRVYIGPRVYAPPPPAYVPRYLVPVNPYYARKAHIFRGIGIPLLALGVPAAIAGGVVWIVGAAEGSRNVTYTGIGLVAGGAGLFIPGAILTGIGNYYRWMARFNARADFNLALGHDGGMGSVRVRF